MFPKLARSAKADRPSIADSKGQRDSGAHFPPRLRFRSALGPAEERKNAHCGLGRANPASAQGRVRNRGRRRRVDRRHPRGGCSARIDAPRHDPSAGAPDEPGQHSEPDRGFDGAAAQREGWRGLCRLPRELRSRAARVHLSIQSGQIGRAARFSGRLATRSRSGPPGWQGAADSVITKLPTTQRIAGSRRGRSASFTHPHSRPGVRTSHGSR